MFNVGDNIVYPMHGAGTIDSIEEKEILGEKYSSILLHPNNILSIEYLKSLSKLNSKITPYTVKRIGVNHNSVKTYKNFASASYIRDLIRNNDKKFYKYIPKSSYAIISREINHLNAPADVNLIERAILSNLRTMTKENILNLCDISEGIEGRIFKYSRFFIYFRRRPIHPFSCSRYQRYNLINYFKSQ